MILKRTTFTTIIFCSFCIANAAVAGCPNLNAAGGESPEGAQVYNYDHKTMQFCDGTTWWAMKGTALPVCPEGDSIIMTSGGWDCDGGGPPTGCDNIGDTCSDGSVYAGLSPDGDVAMYTTPGDSGQFTWDDGSANSVNTALENCTNGTPGSELACRTGKANTALLVSLSGSGSPAPYAAATYCDGLSAHGRDDWYLPAQDELDVLYDNRAAIGGFNTGGSFPAGWYWSSSEHSNNDARVQAFSNGTQGGVDKDFSLSVRCVRR